MANVIGTPTKKGAQAIPSSRGNAIQSTNPINILQSTAADVIVREVHDWELDVLTDGEQSDVKTVAFACLGLAGGFLQNAISLVSNILSGKIVTLFELVLASCFIVSSCVGATCWFLGAGRRSIAKVKKEEIRSRQLSNR